MNNKYKTYGSILLNCKGCNKEISVYRHLYNNSKTKNFFCNRECYDNNRGKVVNRNSIYLTRYRCRSCDRYIRHEKAIRKYKSKHGEDLKHPYLVCPDPDCKNNRLNTTPRHNRRNEIYRMQLKELRLKKKKQQQQEVIPIIDTTLQR